MNYLNPELNVKDVNSLSILALAHIGDSVFELLVRTKLCMNEHRSAFDLHKSTVSIVNAVSQAKYAEKILPFLNEEEISVYKRGRNAKVNSIPKNASVAEYHKATGVEALFGWLYLNGKKDRIEELFYMLKCE
jgi:Uncharacterized protein conserved in bacteria